MKTEHLPPIVSIDPGTGNHKVYRGGDPQNKGVTKAKNAIGKAGDRLLSDGHDLPIRMKSIEGRNKPYSADEYALEYGGIASTTQDRDCIESLNVERGIMAALAKSGIKNGDKLAPIFCIPISEFAVKDKQTGKRPHVQYLKERWIGEHTFTVWGKEQVRFEFTDPKVTMQGIAAAYHYAFSTDGKVCHDITQEDVFLVDTGKRDANYAWIHKGNNSYDDYTGTLDGMSWSGVIKEVNLWLSAEYGTQFTDLEVEYACMRKRPYQDERGESREGFYIFWKEHIDLDEILQDNIATAARKQTDQISSYPLDKAPHLLLCGAPAVHFLPYYQQNLDSRFKLISPFYDIATVLGGYHVRQVYRQKKGE
jgi:hypothetical protein